MNEQNAYGNEMNDASLSFVSQRTDRNKDKTITQSFLTQRRKGAKKPQRRIEFFAFPLRLCVFARETYCGF